MLFEQLKAFFFDYVSLEFWPVLATLLVVAVKMRQTKHLPASTFHA